MTWPRPESAPGFPHHIPSAAIPEIFLTKACQSYIIWGSEASKHERRCGPKNNQYNLNKIVYL